MELFPALPEELGRKCLVRVPYTSHNNLAAVCRSWEAEVKNPQFYQDRKTLGVSQQFICLIELRVNRDYTKLEYAITVYDPQQGTWETVPRLPHHLGYDHELPLFGSGPEIRRCVCVNRKLLLIGRSNLFIYDFISASWSRGADMPTPVGKYFAFSVSLEGLVYAAGGTDNDEEAVRRAAVYNVEEDEWKLLPDMNRGRTVCFGAFINDKFFVIGGFSAESVGGFDQNAEVYNPKTGAWTTLQNMWTVAGGEGGLDDSRPVGSSDGRFYWFHKEQGVMEYDSKENVWRAAGSLPLLETLGTITYCAAWRDMIFVSCDAHDGIGRDIVFYMLKPPPKECAAVTQEKFLGEWVAVPIQTPQHFHGNCGSGILSAGIIEI